MGANIAAVRERQKLLWAAWSQANFQRAKKLPAIMPLLKSLEQKRDMTDKELRTTIFGMARAMGAKITYKKRGDP